MLLWRLFESPESIVLIVHFQIGILIYRTMAFFHRRAEFETRDQVLIALN